jgi:uncharacterized protein (DUF2141 family)
MYRRIIAPSLLSVFLICSSQKDMLAQKYTVNIKINNLSSKKGQLLISIFNKETGFPENNKAAYSTLVFKEPLRSNLSLFLPKGSYAFAIVHDKNSNNKMDKNLVGAPTEAYGVSLNKTYLLKAPEFEENKFILVKDTSLIITLK